jgi:hypothetical protein
MQKWEYLTVGMSRDFSLFGKPSEWEPKIDLETLGNEGWELVSVIPIADHHGGYSGITDRIFYYLKRPKE